MEIIDKMTEKITDEIHDAACYAKMAMEYHDSHPDLARMLYEISLEEMDHMRRLHDATVEIIEGYKSGRE